VGAVNQALDRDGIIKILDHAVVSWPVGEPHPRTKHSHEETWTGTTWGAFIGLAVGALFAVPLLGVGRGRRGGALYKISEGIGITKEDLDRIHSEITEGTSGAVRSDRPGRPRPCRPSGSTACTPHWWTRT
jgi:uncharacterized membrane protein